MAKKYGTDDPGVEDFDWDDNDFDFDFDKKDDRKPVTKFKSAFANAAVESFKTPDFYAGMLRKALPSEYGDALDDASNIFGKAGELYNKSAKSLEPLNNDLRTIAKSFIPSDSKYTPRMLKEWMEGSDSKAGNRDPNADREAMLSMELNSLFKADMVQNAKSRDENRNRENAKFLLDKNASIQQINALDRIRSGIGRLVGYQDTIGSRYQRKSLEISTRQLFVAQDILAEIKRSNAEHAQAFAAVVKNTALPDGLKLSNKEAFGQNLRERFINKFTDPAVRSLNQLTDRLANNFSNYLAEQVGFVKDTTESLAMAVETMDGFGMDKATMAGGMMGTLFTNLFGEAIGTKINEKFAGKSSKIKAGALKLNKLRRNAGSRVMDWADDVDERAPIAKDKYGRTIDRSRSGLWRFLGEKKDDEEVTGYNRDDLMKGRWFKDFVLDMIGQRKSDDVIAKDFYEYSQDPVAFNALTRRTVVDVIPGYLARILREVTVLRTGDDNAETLVYNPGRGQFMPISAKRAELKDRIRRRAGAQYTGMDLNELTNTIDDTGRLSPEARETLKRELLRRSKDGKEFDPRVMANQTTYHQSVPGIVREELSKFFTDRYQTDRERKLGENVEIDVAIDKADRQYTRLSDRLPEIVAEIQRQIENGHQNDLVSMGFIKVDQDGRVLLNTDAIFDLIIAESNNDPYGSKYGTTNSIYRFAGNNKAAFKMHSSFVKLQSKSASADSQFNVNLGSMREAAKGAATSAVGSMSDYLTQGLGLGKGWFTKASQYFSDNNFVDRLKTAIDTGSPDAVKNVIESAGAKPNEAARAVRNANIQAASDEAPSSAGDDINTRILNTLLESLTVEQNIQEGVAAISGQLAQGLEVHNHNYNHDGKRRFGIRKGIKSAIGGFLSGSGSVMKWGGKFWGRMIGLSTSMLGGMGSLAVGGLRLGGRLLGGLGIHYGDIYKRSDRKNPILFGKDIRAGRYLDVTTNKVVKSLTDIKGPVKDVETGEVVLTEADFKEGLIDTSGKPVLKNLANKVIGMYSAMYSPVGAAISLGTTLIRGTTNALLTAPSIYVKGDPSPRLLSKIMRDGGYRSKKTGRVIRSHVDIDGDVVDASGEIVLTAADVKTGLVDRRGKKLRTKMERIVDAGKLLWDTAGAGIKFALKSTAGIYNFAWTSLKTMGGFLKRGLGFKQKPKTMDEATFMATSQSNELLAQIYALLDARLPGKRSKFDGDGDGDRDGSWQDILKARKDAAAKKAEELKNKATAASASGAGMFGSFMAKFRDILSGNDDGEDGDTIIAGGDLDLGGEGDEKDKKGKRKGSKPRGRFGKAWDWTKRAGSKAWEKMPGKGTLSRVAPWLGRGALATGGVAAASTAASAGSAGLLSTIGTGLLATVTSPLAILGGLGGVYHYTKKWTAVPGPLTSLRLMQYGVRPSDRGQVETIAKAEDFLLDYVRFTGDNASFQLTKPALVELLTMFGIDPADSNRQNQWLSWFDGRFKPVFLKSIAALRGISRTIELVDIDNSDMTPTDKFNYLSKVNFGAGFNSPYNIVSSPFGNSGITIAPHEIEDIVNGLIDSQARRKEDDAKVNTFTTALGTMAPNTALAINKLYGTAADRMQKTGDLRAASALKSYTPNPNQSLLPAAGSALVTEASVIGGKIGLLRPLEIIRMKAYGLKDLEMDKVRQMLELEKGVLERLKISQNGQVKFDASVDEYAQRFAAGFGVSSSNEAGQRQWRKWFSERFLAVFTTYISAIRKLSASINLENVSLYLKLDMQLQVADAVISAKVPGFIWSSSVWSVTDSPWPDYVLNTDSASTKANLDVLKSQAKNSVYSDASSMAAKNAQSKPVKTPGFFGMFERSDNPTINNSQVQETYEAGKSAPSGIKKVTPTVSLPSVFDTKTPTANLPKGYLMPASGKITSPYGMRMHPTKGKMKFHNGIDIGAPRGTPVKAAYDGEITQQYYSESYGNIITIRHPDGKYTKYAHMNNFQPGLGVGTAVTKGTVIGYVGSTGWSTGDHLHFEIRDGAGPNAKSIDPLPLLSNTKAVAEAKTELKEEQRSAKVEDKPNPNAVNIEGSDTVASTALGKPTLPVKSLFDTPPSGGFSKTSLNTGLGAPSIPTTADLRNTQTSATEMAAELTKQQRTRDIEVATRRKERVQENINSSTTNMTALMAENNRLTGLIHAEMVRLNTTMSNLVVEASKAPAANKSDDKAVSEKVPAAVGKPVATSLKKLPVSVRKPI